MTPHDLIVQRPAAPSQLVLLFHRVGSSARDLVPLDEALAPHLPAAAIVSLQAACAIGPAGTTLIGFSQGAIMALESTQLDSPLAARVIALSGRFARPPRIAHASARTHLMHKDADAVMPVRGAVDALAQLQGFSWP